MRHRSLRLAAVAVLVGAFVSAGATTSTAAPTVNGREWRELFETTGLSWSEVASVCPTDGATACSGTVRGRNLTGWTWATSAQVRDLLDDHAPGLATADPPVVSGLDGFWGGISFLGVMRWTTYSSTTYSYSESTSGWTSSKDAAGVPIGGFAAYSHSLAGGTANGTIGLGTAPDAASTTRGIFLWRPAGVDYTAPVVTPTVTGTLGNQGWYRSNVSVSWAVTDNESPVTSRVGCDPSTLSTDSAGTAYTCTATSVGGQGSGSVTVKRDATPPTIACGATPTFELGQSIATVPATVTDAMSGPPSATISRLVPTTVAGTLSAVMSAADRAGNTASQTCPYTVVSPRCQGSTPTILGTAGNDVLRGTAGADVIHGLGGADRIEGLGAGDKLCGGDGPDDIYGGAGADTLDGGAGSDSLRGDDGSDRCTSGEVRTSSCELIF